MKKVVVLGLDGLEPGIVEPMLVSGELPNLARLRARGGYGRVATTTPAQTPVAWSTFATGTNPGGHGIFDFIRRDPATYLPDLALTRYEQKNAFVPPRAVNLRRGEPIWSLLSAAGVPSVILRCPCTFPPDESKARVLSGMGVPDLRGGLGTSMFWTSKAGVQSLESENVIPVEVRGDEIKTHLIGPRNPKTGQDHRLDIVLRIDRSQDAVAIQADGQPRLIARAGAWSDWLRVKFKSGMLQAVHGMVRFHLVRLDPVFELYASPVNFDPHTPLFPISAPWHWADELSREIGLFYTTGMVEDHTGLNNGRFGEAAYLDQCALVMRERENMMTHELERFREGLLFCLFDTPDRVQHMFWRFRQPAHPALLKDPEFADPHKAAEFACVIDDHYRECDAVVGRALEHVDDDTLFIVLSDHGFGSFRRGVNLNNWLHEHGYLSLQAGEQGRNSENGGEFFRGVNWDDTRAYALGLGSIYLNVKGREANGIVDASEADALAAEIVQRLTGVQDPQNGNTAIRGVALARQVYAGPYVAEGPDLVVRFADGYRVSWPTALGGMGTELVEDNLKRWSGDHIMDPEIVPGVLFMNRPFRTKGARLLDLAPTILGAFGVRKGAAMEGKSLSET